MPASRPFPTERHEQEALVERADLTLVPEGRLGHFLFAIPNGAWLQGDHKKRSGLMGILKRTGLRSGAPDLYLMLPRGRWLSLQLEMKRDRRAFRSRREGRDAWSDVQRQWARRAIKIGHRYRVCYGQDEAWQAIVWYLGLGPPRRQETWE